MVWDKSENTTNKKTDEGRKLSQASHYNNLQQAPPSKMSGLHIVCDFGELCGREKKVRKGNREIEDDGGSRFFDIFASTTETLTILINPRHSQPACDDKKCKSTSVSKYMRYGVVHPSKTRAWKTKNYVIMIFHFQCILLIIEREQKAPKNNITKTRQNEFGEKATILFICIVIWC